jgi:acetoacetate decarboxylase
MVYLVNIREPTFAPWYMEGGLMLICRYGEMGGVYFLNLQLSGPGALMGLCSGRESGLPKKLCERIVVERTGATARALIVAKGRRIFDVEVEIGGYNDPLMDQMCAGLGPGARLRSSCFLFQCGTGKAPDGHAIYEKVNLVNYDSATDYKTWEPARIQSLTMEQSLDDPWAEISVVKLLGAGYSVNSNPILGVSVLEQFEGEEADGLMPYLFSGRWDRSTISGGGQRYGQF